MHYMVEAARNFRSDLEATECSVPERRGTACRAEKDLATALRLYRREAGRAFTTRFIDEFERVTNLLAANPDLGTPTADQRR